MWGKFVDGELLRVVQKMKNFDDQQAASQTVLEALMSSDEGEIILPDNKDFSVSTSHKKVNVNEKSTSAATGGFRDPSSLFNKG